jgi:ATP-dependent RNA helicase SUPV3L1/SUV3
VESLVDAKHDSFEIDASGKVVFQGEAVGRLSKGAELSRPQALLTVGQDLGAGARMRMQRRLSAVVRDFMEGLLEPLRKDCLLDLSPNGRGLLYLLEQRLGTVHMNQARSQVGGLCPDDRRRFKDAGIVVGTQTIFARALLNPPAVQKRVIVCSVYLSLRSGDQLPDGTETSCAIEPALGSSVYTAMGYPPVGDRGLRADMWERVRGSLSRASSDGPFVLPANLSAWLGVGEDSAEMENICRELGYRRVNASPTKRWERKVKSKRRRRRTSGH